MKNDFLTLTRVELFSLYGINKIRHTRDKSAKRRYIALGVVLGFVAALMAFYVCGLCYALGLFGLGNIIPSYLAFICSAVVFAFGIFKAGSVMFSASGYNILAALPLRRGSVAISRFAAMYIEDTMLCALLFLPGAVMYAVMCSPVWYFYPLALVSVLLLPLLPLSLSLIVGGALTAIFAKIKQRSVIFAVLTVVLVLAVLFGVFMLAGSSANFSLDALFSLLGEIGDIIEKIYPPAAFLGWALCGTPVYFLAFVGISAGACAIVLSLVCLFFDKAVKSLCTTGTGKKFDGVNAKRKGILPALIKKEAHAYFSSGIYVTNTVIGPILAVIGSAVILFFGVDKINGAVSLPFDIATVIPFAVSAILCMMCPSCVSLSMEGKRIWLSKTLPLRARQLFDAKILFGLLVMTPGYVLSEILLIIALRPAPLELLWLLIIPLCLCAFTAVFGMWINVKIHSFDWEREEQVVKQSAPAALGGFAGAFVSLFCGAVCAFTPVLFSHIARLTVCAVLLIGAQIMRRDCAAVELDRL